MHITRRTFMQASLCAAAAASAARADAPQAPFLFGMCVGPDKAERLKALGYDFIEGGVGGTLKPHVSDADFAPELEKLRACALPTRSCNGFLPKELTLTGPETRHDDALAYAVTACRRADAAGISVLVFGSGGARNAPKDFDIEKAKTQFIEFNKRLGAAIADLKVTVLLEPLNKAEANYLTTVAEGAEMVDAVAQPRIQLIADIYHMRKDGESPDSIRKAGARIRHCHIAELDRRAPGAKGDDFRDYFKALRDIGYTGGVSCECGWPKENVAEAWEKALSTLREQSRA
ncbi:MAG: sugar phosphate isomerase/epimerase [Verrucomicrobiota bacterium]|jgi:sugar phosphate isomerase/epimerase|nr:sugar phosphate isomerase/epimerase [Verrucomicrobiota bacterium]